jgi:hypothetical protein
MRIIFYYSVGATTIELSSWFFVLFGKQNMFLFKTSLLFQCLSLSIYFFVLISEKNFRNILKGTLAFAILYSFLQLLVESDSFIRDDQLSYAILIIPVVIYCIYSFAKGLSDSKISSYGLLNFGMFLYLSSSSIIFLTRDILLYEIKLSLDLFNYIYIINNLIYIFFLTIILKYKWRSKKVAY